MLDRVIFELESRLLRPETRRSRSELEALLSPEFVEFTSSGLECTREDAVRALASEVPLEWQIDSFTVRELAPGLALATYRGIRTARRDQSPQLSLRSSIWSRSAGEWRLVFHQGTRVGA
jgi:hypothetical protein